MGNPVRVHLIVPGQMGEGFPEEASTLAPCWSDILVLTLFGLSAESVQISGPPLLQYSRIGICDPARFLFPFYSLNSLKIIAGSLSSDVVISIS